MNGNWESGSQRSSFADDSIDSPGIHQDGVVEDFLRKNRDRNRHLSGASIDVPVLGENFTSRDLEQYLSYFIDNKIRKHRITQHLTGAQEDDSGKATKNFPKINAQAVDNGWTALHWAAAHGHHDLVQALLNSRADPKILNHNLSSPIHLAIKSDYDKVVATLLNSDRSLINSSNQFAGWFPIHTAAYYLATKSIEILLHHGARAHHLTDKSEMTRVRLTPFHLASGRATVLKEKVKVSGLVLSRQMSTTSATEEDELLSKVFKVLDLLMDQPQEAKISPVVDDRHGSILHYFCMINYASGVEKLLQDPFCHEPDVVDVNGVSPLLVSLASASWESALLLLDHDVDVERVHVLMKHQSPLQLVLNMAASIEDDHLAIVDKLIEKGADPTKSADDTDSPVTIATSSTLSVKVLDKFLPHIPAHYINLSDKHTGDTLLHHAVVNRESETIVKILEKGADVMRRNFTYNCLDDSDRISEGKLPVQIAIEYQRSEHYFEALETFGLHQLFRLYTDQDERRKIVGFLKTHLCASAKERNHSFFRDICSYLNRFHDHIFNPTDSQIDSIIHFRDCCVGTLFSKTALNWANQNNDKIMSLELLKLEKDVHKTKVEGLECLRSNLSSDALLPWIVDTFGNFYENDANCRWIMAWVTVFLELVVFSYIPFFYDFYSDVILAFNYKTIAYDDETYKKEQLFNCSDNLTSTCFQDFDHDRLRGMFEIAFWITMASLIISSIFYIASIMTHSNPSFIVTTEAAWREALTKKGLHKMFVSTLCKVFKWTAAFACKLAWPVVHVLRKVRYNASVKRSEYKERTTESDDTWNVIKTVEYGLESSIQLFLQLWLLKPFFSDMALWSWEDLVRKSIHGVANFLTFSIFPACYIEKALGKILLTVIALTLGVSLMKSTKPGLGPCERPLRTLPIFLSMLAQTTCRIMALKSLILLESEVQYFKYLIFFTIHFFLVFVIKIMFETKSAQTKCPTSPSKEVKRLFYQSRATLKKLSRFVISGISSSIIMVHLHHEETEKRSHEHSFVSHFCFFILIFVENVALVMMPYINPRYFPYADCFPNHKSDILSVILLWVLGVLFQVVHYKWSHPWAALNGPRNVNSSLMFFTKCCWLPDVQRVSLDTKSNTLRLQNMVARGENADESDSLMKSVSTFMDQSLQAGGAPNGTIHMEAHV